MPHLSVQYLLLRSDTRRHMILLSQSRSAACNSLLLNQRPVRRHAPALESHFRVLRVGVCRSSADTSSDGPLGKSPRCLLCGLAGLPSFGLSPGHILSDNTDVEHSCPHPSLTTALYARLPPRSAVGRSGWGRRCCERTYPS